ncbi:hypothetical protein [Streptomyces sp. NPDC004267]
MVLAVDELGGQAGVLAPEGGANPEQFYAALARTGPGRRRSPRSSRR